VTEERFIDLKGFEAQSAADLKERGRFPRAEQSDRSGPTRLDVVVAELCFKLHGCFVRWIAQWPQILRRISLGRQGNRWNSLQAILVFGGHEAVNASLS
jgi:hypothetical protein